MKRLGGGEIHHPLSRGMDEKGLSIALDGSEIHPKTFLLKSFVYSSSKIYFWASLLRGAHYS